uniref:PHB domain-containing protein n=1 Tax=Gongylonema pulchrum TaxID=637853 RepID=A0A183E4U3_9BILA
LVSSQRMDDRLLVTNYNAKITDLHGEIEARMACIANQVYLMACFCGRPELDIELVNTDSSSAGAVSRSLVDEAIRKCLLSAVTNISLTESLGQRSSGVATGTVPASAFSPISRVVAGGGAGIIGSSVTPASTPVQEMMKRIGQSTQLTNQSAKLQGAPNKVRVKVIRAQRLGGDRSTDFSSNSTNSNPAIERQASTIRFDCAAATASANDLSGSARNAFTTTAAATTTAAKNTTTASTATCGL